MDAARLIEHWTERDDRYAQRWIDGRPAPLTPEECAAISVFRISEALMVPAGKGREAALRYVRGWHPPRVNPWRDPINRLDDENARHRARWRRRVPHG